MLLGPARTAGQTVLNSRRTSHVEKREQGVTQMRVRTGLLGTRAGPTRRLKMCVAPINAANSSRSMDSWQRARTGSPRSVIRILRRHASSFSRSRPGVPIPLLWRSVNYDSDDPAGMYPAIQDCGSFRGADWAVAGKLALAKSQNARAAGLNRECRDQASRIC